MSSNIQLFNMDCMEAMKQMPDKAFDLAIVDPPYGIGMGGNAQIKSLKSRPKWTGCKYKENDWDKETPDNKYFEELLRTSNKQIIWGGNYFTDYLSAKKGWIFWDKRMNHNDNFSHGELAWSSFDSILRMFSYTATGYSMNKIHPTEKPVALYKWLLKNYAKEGDKILDTHFGSGSIAIACHDMGYDLTGYEIDKDYYDAAVKRLENHKKQLTLF